MFQVFLFEIMHTQTLQIYIISYASRRYIFIIDEVSDIGMHMFK